MARIVFHSHSNASRDCTVPPSRIAQRLHARGIDTLFLTDHDVINSTEITSVTIIRSEEITTKEGEIIGIFLNRFIAPGQTLQATLDEIHRQGGLAVVPHPFDRLRSKRIMPTVLDRHIDDIDIVEVFNARTVFKSDDLLARNYATKYNKPCIYGSDAHTIWEYGLVWMEGVDCSSPQTFLKTLPNATPHVRSASLLVHGVTKYVKWLNAFKNSVD